MSIVGHFDSLAEAQKLVQSKLLAGVVQETYEEGQLLQKLPVFTIDAKSIIYNREKEFTGADFYDIHEQIPWKADAQFATQVEVTLKRMARQSILDNFIMKTYKDPNDYRSIIMSGLTKMVLRGLEDKFIYGNATDAPKEFDGLNVLCPATGGHAFGDYQDYDAGGAANITPDMLLALIDKCKPKPDVLLMTRAERNKITKATWGKAGAIVYASSLDQFGRRVESIDGVPVMVSDYLSDNEVDNTGKKGSGTNLSSIYAIRFGQIEEGGLCLCTGGDTGGVDFFKLVDLEALEDYDAEGIRLVAYCAMALGSTKAIARIHSILQTADITL